MAQQAAAIEPLIQEYWRQGRQGLRSGQRAVWGRMAEDGLLDAAVDLEWLVDTASVVVSPETYLLITRIWNGTSKATKPGSSAPSAAWSG